MLHRTCTYGCRSDNFQFFKSASVTSPELKIGNTSYQENRFNVTLLRLSSHFAENIGVFCNASNFFFPRFKLLLRDVGLSHVIHNKARALKVLKKDMRHTLWKRKSEELNNLTPMSNGQEFSALISATAVCKKSKTITWHVKKGKSFIRSTSAANQMPFLFLTSQLWCPWWRHREPANQTAPQDRECGDSRQIQDKTKACRNRAPIPEKIQNSTVFIKISNAKKVILYFLVS